MRAFLSGLIVSLVMMSPVVAQDRAQSLADIRTELSALNSEINSLRTELTSTGSSNVALNGPALLKIDQIEEEMRAMTGKLEQLEFRIDRVVQDGTNRIGDLEFRLVELEGGDISTLGKTSTLGGDDVATVAPSSEGSTGASTVQLAVAEKQDFDAAVRAIEGGQNAGGILLMEGFLQSYPSSALTGDAHYWLGRAQGETDDWNAAARSFLASVKIAPQGEFAGLSMQGLGKGLGKLGKVDQACQTLHGVADRYPDHAQAVDMAAEEIHALGCS